MIYIVIVNDIYCVACFKLNNAFHKKICKNKPPLKYITLITYILIQKFVPFLLL